MGASAVGIAITAAERRVVRRLRAAGARSAETAQPLGDTRRLGSRRLAALMDAGAIREAAPRRYFVDDAAYAAYRGDRRAVAAAVALASVGAVLALSFYAARG
jgi:hypothetical protein